MDIKPVVQLLRKFVTLLKIKLNRVEKKLLDVFHLDLLLRICGSKIKIDLNFSGDCSTYGEAKKKIDENVHRCNDLQAHIVATYNYKCKLFQMSINPVVMD